jgi:hypothetical protein
VGTAGEVTQPFKGIFRGSGNFKGSHFLEIKHFKKMQKLLFLLEVNNIMKLAISNFKKKITEIDNNTCNGAKYYIN